jgi:small subunit ribosomal protein S17
VSENRSVKKVRVGVVVSDAMDKTAVVQVERWRKHPKYKKYIKQTRRFKVHDESNECRTGDSVRFTETRPISREKCWKLVEIIERAK